MTSAANIDRSAESRPVLLPPEDGPKHMLLVDDDPNFRSIVHLTLKRLGYAALAAGGPEEAVEIATRNKGIRLLITDVAMPGMNGVELAEKIREIQPHVKVLFISGFPLKGVAGMGVETGSVNFLQKPFHPGDLDARIKKILAGG